MGERMNKQDLIIQEKKELIDAIVNVEAQKKALEKQEKAMREKLQTAMEDYGVLLIENDQFSVQYFPETTREQFDSKAFCAENEILAEMYTKTVPVKASIRFRLKGEK